MDTVGAMTTYSVAQIAALTGYTERQIRNLCAAGHLKSTLTPTGYGWARYTILKSDYLEWLSNPPRPRRRWKGKRGMRK